MESTSNACDLLVSVVSVEVDTSTVLIKILRSVMRDEESMNCSCALARTEDDIATVEMKRMTL